MSRIAFIMILVVSVVAGGCTRPRPEAQHRNVILITVDTLRADHLGCYGYARPTTPRIDAFRRDAMLFEEAIAHAPSTLPSHASLLTSLLPSHHGASVANSFALDPEALTLSERLRAEGYATASYNGGIQLDRVYGLDRGFDRYVSARPSDAIAEVLVDEVDMFDHTVDEAIRWIESTPDKPFFLFLHTYEVHHPYTPTAEALAAIGAEYDGALPNDISVELLMKINDGEVVLEPGDLEHIVSTYDAELRSADAAFGRLIDYLRERGLYEDALIVLTSDHGEEFGEHGFVGWHSHTLYDELLRVPLLIKLPGARDGGARVSQQVRGIDVAPTILDALDIEIPPAFEGTSLLHSSAVTEPAPEPAVSRQDVVTTQEFASVRTREWKWIQGRLFHLAVDPAESQDVAQDHEEIAAGLTASLDAMVARRPIPPPEAAEPDAELEQRLRALGYLE